MSVGVWVLGDQLWEGQAALQTCDRNTPVLMIESIAHAQERPFHLQKIVLVWSAMRHFAEELRSQGWQVDYAIEESFEAPLLQWIHDRAITELRIMQPVDRPFQQMLQAWNLPCKLSIVPSNRYIWQDDEFLQWANSRKRLVMEDFYREGRRRFNILMVGDQPKGGKWNFDRNNRKPPKGKLTLPEALWFTPDKITQDVIDWIKTDDRFAKSQEYWSIEPFQWGVTRKQALQVLEFFIETRLSDFGPYQDAMVTGEQTMWHAMLSPYLNIGLLHPLEVVEAAATAYETNSHWDLSSVEGFVRQVMGWREYMHGVYVFADDDYRDRNWFGHDRPLPDFFWTGETEMNCLHQIISQVRETGYAHHIQRLMVLNNFALISGISPQEIESWFHAAFVDAYDWVMQTNVIGMGQYADGGLLASKPYAASANYINNMSNYCRNCTYSPKVRTGDRACPFNFFYWNFLDRHRTKLKNQGRISLILRSLERFSDEELADIRQEAINWHEQPSP